MPADALASIARLRESGSRLDPTEQRSADRLERFLLDSKASWREVAERSAAMLAPKA